MNEPKVQQWPPTQCVGPAAQICDASGCRCLPMWNQPEPFACEAPLVPFCTRTECFCIKSPHALLEQPVAPGDACSLVIAIVVAGIKKTLLACWVDG